MGTDASDNRIGTILRLSRLGGAVVLTVFGIVFHDRLHDTPYRAAEYAVFLSAYLLVGAPVVLGALRNIVRGRVFDELFLMSVATIGAIVIHQMAEAVAVMFFYAMGEYVQDLAVGRSRRSISSLLGLRPDSARLLAADGPLPVRPEEVAVGSTIEVWPGERVPLDGEVVDGQTSVDTSALTGESVPRMVGAGDGVLAGFVNGAATIRVRVTRPYAESSVARILELVETAAERKAPTERFFSRFAAVYTPIMVGIAAAVAFIPPLVVPGATLGVWVYRALVVLVISCPCALVVSIPLGYFGGIGGAARRGILIKGASFVDTLRDVRTVVFDKTGTLTRGVFRVTKVVTRNGFRSDELLRRASLAEANSTHPVAGALRDAWAATAPPSDPGSPAAAVTEVREERGYGVTATVDGRRIIAGSDRLLHREGIVHTDCEAEGTVVYVVVDSTYAGYLLVSDEIRPEAARAVTELRAAGVDRIVMLTGDNRHIAERVAREAGIDEYVAELLPEEKVAEVERISGELDSGKRLAFVGDGINDAPVLMRSDVGFAMGALGSEAAIEAADIVVLDDSLDRVPEALDIARFTRTVVWQNIVLALGVKAAFLALGAAGVASMWEAVIADVGVSLLATLNATRTLARRERRGHRERRRADAGVAVDRR